MVQVMIVGGLGASRCN